MPSTTRGRVVAEQFSADLPSRSGPGTLTRTLLLFALAVLAALLAAPAPAGAEYPSQDDQPEGSGTEVRGTLRAEDDDGETIFVEGVVFIVSDADGNEVGQGATDAEGVWSVGLPGAGTYSVLLDETTLPEGISVRNPDNNPLTFDVQEGASRATLFPLGERRVSDGGTIEAVQLLVDGIKLGLIIGMCAIGLSLIYGTTGLTNFAHGEMVTFGAMIAFVFHVTGMFGVTTSLFVAAVLTFIVCGFAGGVFNQFVWKPLRNRGASLISALVVSIGFSILFRYILLYRFGGRARFYRDYQLQSKIDLGWFSLAPKDLFIIVFSIIVLVLIGLGLQKTRAGKAMRAVADNRDLAESSGIDVERVIRWVWVAGSALAGLGGVLFGLTESIGWEMGFRILLLMFASVTLGGLGSAYGALLGALVVGVFIQMSTMVIPSDMKNVGALLMLIVILMVRPQGLLGRPERIG
jgi:neutral amino acid transport system permease protein